MRTTIESKCRHFRAVLTETADDVVHVQLLRHAGSIDCRGAGVDGPSMWRQLEAFEIRKPFRLVAEHIYDLVRPMEDKRPPAHYASARRI